MAQIAQYRRFLLPEEERFSVFFDKTIKEVKDISPAQKDVPLTRAVRAIILLALIAAICTTIVAMVIPKEGEKFTEFYILGQNGTAVDYPIDLKEGVPGQVIIGIGNHEYQNTNYIVEVWLTNMTIDSTTNMTFISQMEKLDQFSLTLQHNIFYKEPHRFTAPATGFNKLTFLLFKDTAPPDSVTGFERINSSYRNLQLWVTVRPPIESRPVLV
jgi:uncharacterized membrane protein